MENEKTQIITTDTSNDVINEQTINETKNIVKDFFAPLQEKIDGTFLDNNYITAIAVIIGTFIISYIFTFIYTKVLTGIFSRTKTTIDDKLIAIFEKPIFDTIALAGLTLAIFPFFHEKTFWILLIKIILTVVGIIWSLAFIKTSKELLKFLAFNRRKTFVKRQTLPLFLNLSSIVLFLIFTYVILSGIWKVNMTALIASMGVAGIAIGFAAKDTLSNLLSGILILADQPYKIGDYIVLDDGTRGEVKHIGIRSTRILTRGDVEATIPNSIMGNTIVINESGGPSKKMRIKVPVGVAYGSSVPETRKVLEKVLTGFTDKKLIAKSPEARLRLRTLGASSLDFDLLAWVNDPGERGKIVDLMTEEVYNKLNEAKIEIPYNKQDVYIKEFPGK